MPYLPLSLLTITLAVLIATSSSLSSSLAFALENNIFNLVTVKSSGGALNLGVVSFRLSTGLPSSALLALFIASDFLASSALLSSLLFFAIVALFLRSNSCVDSDLGFTSRTRRISSNSRTVVSLCTINVLPWNLCSSPAFSFFLPRNLSAVFDIGLATLVPLPCTISIVLDSVAVLGGGCFSNLASLTLAASSISATSSVVFRPPLLVPASSAVCFSFSASILFFLFISANSSAVAAFPNLPSFPILLSALPCLDPTCVVVSSTTTLSVLFSFIFLASFSFFLVTALFLAAFFSLPLVIRSSLVVTLPVALGVDS